jgi:Fur family ferric uptake transcriptional regulator
MEISTSEKILLESSLRKTAMRLGVIEVLLHANGAISKKDIEDHFGKDIDRVTLYRTLKTFEDKGVIHAVSDLDGGFKYALCQSDCHPGHHHDSHVHFTCQECGITRCLDDTPVPELIVPGKLQVMQVQVVASGICEHCNPAATQ